MSYSSDCHLLSQGLEIESGIAAVFTLPNISFCRLLLCEPDIQLKSDPNGYAGCLKSQGAINYSLVLLLMRKTAQHKVSAAFHSKSRFFPHWVTVCHYLLQIPLKVGLPCHLPAHKGLNSTP